MRASTTPCSSVASIWRRHSSSPALFQQRIRPRILIERSAPQQKYCAVFEIGTATASALPPIVLRTARFARPTAHIIYSRYAVIAPYRGITAFEFRIVNGRDNQIVDLSASVILTRFETNGAQRQRRYYPLPLERPSVAFFPLAWTVVHPVDPHSPIWGWDEPRMRAAGAEFLILLRGTDETFAQTVQSRSSYAADEIRWGVRFASIFREEDGALSLNMQRFDAVEPAQLPEGGGSTAPGGGSARL